MSDYDYASQMKQIQAQNAQTISQYFSKLPTTTKSSTNSEYSGIIDNLQDYGLIRKGSYKKLMKAYYKNMEEAASDPADAKSFVLSKNDAKALKKDADALASFSFEKSERTVKGEDGKETTKVDYDRDGLYKAAAQFIKSYNDSLDSVSELDHTTILKRALRMTKQTSVSENLLSKAGITIDKNNKLSIDEEKFKKADDSVLKTLFHGSNSYVKKIADKAAEIGNLSENAARTLTGDRTYTSGGNLTNISTSTMYDSFL